MLDLVEACGAVTVEAQQTSGSISGMVVDSQGALVVGAKITLTDDSPGLRRQVETSSSGGCGIQQNRAEGR